MPIDCPMTGSILGTVMPIAALLLITLGIAALGKYLFFTPRNGASS
ncbi:hypothetical protein [Halomonas sp. NO4]|nr:hypothetical protein [Halomonas sp. NO4]